MDAPLTGVINRTILGATTRRKNNRRRPAVGKIKIEAGDFKKGSGSKFVSLGGLNEFHMMTNEAGWTGYKVKKYRIDDVEEVDEASEENVKRLGGTVGWGVAGAVILGPVGLLAGLIAGGRGKNVTFVCKFKDGTKMLGTTSSKTFTKIMAARF